MRGRDTRTTPVSRHAVFRAQPPLTGWHICVLVHLRCGVQYLPGLTSKSVERAAAEHPEWNVAPSQGQGVFAIEECLEMLLERVRREKAAGAEGEGGRAAKVAKVE